MSVNALEQILAPSSQDEFFASTWGKSHQHVRGPRGRFAHLLPWERLNEILRRHRLDFPRLRLARDGQSLPVSSYLRHTVSARRKTPIPRLRPAELTAQLREGATLVLDAVDELHEPLENLAAGLELVFREHIQINAYAGWQTTRGFDLHWDEHDVFILQVTGRKRWAVYGATRPHPLAPDIEPAPRPAQPPLWEDTLEDGDLLYIPRGWWHVAVPLAEPTLHLTVGVHHRTGVDLMRWLTDRLRASDLFRTDLPRFASAEALEAHRARLRAELLTVWDDPNLLDGYFREHDAMAAPRPRFSLPWSAAPAPRPLARSTRLRLTAPRPLAPETMPDGSLTLSCNGKRWHFAAPAAGLLQLLDEKREGTLAELCAAMTVGETEARAFAGELIREGLLAIVEE